MSSNIRVQRTCKRCGRSFIARTTVTQYCGNGCSRKAYKERIKAEKVFESDLEAVQQRNEFNEQLSIKPILTIYEACRLIGISRRTLYRLITDKGLPYGKAGSRTLIRRTDLEWFLFNKSIDQ
jgi:excisionase family DNA binding protein